MNILIPNWHFRKTNTTLQLDNCQKTPLWKSKAESFRKFWIQIQRLIKFMIIFVVCGLLDFQRKNNDIQFFYFGPVEISGLKENVMNFLSNRLFREIITPLQIENYSVILFWKKARHNISKVKELNIGLNQN